MAKNTELTFTPIIPLYWVGKALDHIDNSALKELILSNRKKRKPGSEPGDANYEDIPLDPLSLRSKALDELMSEVDAVINAVARVPLTLQGGCAWANIRTKGQSLAYHDHEDPKDPNVDRLSFVYYVQANFSNQPLIYPITLHAHRFDSSFAPKSGHLQVFPSFLPHYTGQENAPTQDRIVIAGNYA